MNQKKKLYLEKVIARGKWSCILRYGVLFLGPTMAAIGSLLDVFLENKSFWESFQESIIFDMAAGVLCGWIFWRSFNKQYEKMVSSQQV